jgi:hypothetical protein
VGKPAAAPAATNGQPRRRRDRFPVSNGNLPHPAQSPVFADCSRRVFLKHMKNIQNEEDIVPGSMQENQVKKLVVLAAVGLKLLRKILEKLESIDSSLNVFAAQKARELNPEHSDSETAK